LKAQIKRLYLFAAKAAITDLGMDPLNATIILFRSLLRFMSFIYCLSTVPYRSPMVVCKINWLLIYKSIAKYRPGKVKPEGVYWAITGGKNSK